MTRQIAILTVLLVVLGSVACEEAVSTFEPPEASADPVLDDATTSYTWADVEEWKATAAIADYGTLAAAGYSEFGVAGFIEAFTVIRHIPFAAYITNQVRWEYEEDGSLTGPYITEDEGFLSIPTPARTTRFGISLDCSTILERGYVKANTTHYASWNFSVNIEGMSWPISINRGPKYSDDREDCPAPDEDGRDTGYTDREEPAGGGGEEDGETYCMVRYWYYVDTGEIIDVEILYCWEEGGGEPEY